MAGAKTSSSEGKAAPSSAVAGRAYATHTTELARPYIPGETVGEQREAAKEWRWIVLAAFATAALLIYTRVWPLVADQIYEPSPLRDLLLPPAAQPLYVVAGVGVGWVWLLFVVAPLSIAAFAGLWWIAVAWNNHRARAGYLGHVRPGQKWHGETYPVGPLILLGAAAVLATGGSLLRWAGPAAATAAGGAVLLGVFLVLGWVWGQLVSWARARGQVTRQINEITFLASPSLGWNDFRAGRVRVVRANCPRNEAPYPKVVKLFYGVHPRHAGDDLTREAGEILTQVTGRTYVFDHDPLTRTLTATETLLVEENPQLTAEVVLEPLVSHWFDAPSAGAKKASIIAVDVAEPVIVIDEDGNLVEEQPLTADEARVAAATENDKIAARITGFTVGFAYNQKVATPYRQGLIEGSVSHALGGSWEATWSLPSLRVRFKRCPGLKTLVDPPLEFPVVNRAVIRSLYKQATIPFAIDAYGNVMVWDFKQSPHMLVAGQTSSGKTSLLMTVATQCARRGFNVVWIDPKGFDSPGMRDWPNVSLVTAGTDEDGMVGHTAALRFIADTMRERLSLVKINPNRADDFDPIIVITDEFSNLVVALTEFYATHRAKNEKGAPPTTIDVGIILRTARAVGIHMAIGIQRPDTMFIGGEARDNTALRVALGRLRSKDAAIMMFNDPVAGTRVQPGIKGRGTLQLPDGTFREIQAFYTPKVPATPEQWDALSDHERHILNHLRDVDCFWQRRVVDSALRNYDPADDKQRAEMSFRVIRDSPIVPASGRPDLDPLSEKYVMPLGTVRRPTMDDDHPDENVSVAWSPARNDEGEAIPLLNPDTTPVSGTFAGPVDGFDDEYMPTAEDEYGEAIPATANEVCQGDLIEVSVDGVEVWRYVHAEPYLSETEDGQDLLVIPYRDLEDSQDMGDVEVDPYEVVHVRQLNMT